MIAKCARRPREFSFDNHLAVALKREDTITGVLWVCFVQDKHARGEGRSIVHLQNRYSNIMNLFFLGEFVHSTARCMQSVVY